MKTYESKIFFWFEIDFLAQQNDLIFHTKYAQVSLVKIYLTKTIITKIYKVDKEKAFTTDVAEK